ncbi:DNA primase small subunit PriS [Candidatus Halobonum tyrrellensis]|uniref:DNA primase small subunit PriS n=1 Tax=Candidatus Halobonum tyrrellensis G22 TaxID=1324957 RepID=V4HAV0_9EURY|nr:DNA primase small subunit PriS [Candidatus Halobonum tyrrellensis]ESP87188.1 DNA primase small subunit [Candidatus Halobonum tyrrellensis G22]
MNRRTREYLKGRFGDYYRSATVSPPPAANEREWGQIPFTEGDGTTMVRHQSLLDVAGGAGDLDDFLAREAPRHAYFSAARYDDPGNRSMSGKGWRSADLVFDLDADHLPGVDPETAGYGEMLAACKEELLNLLDLLETDFGFREEDLSVVFSGGRGYHVHVRDPAVGELDSAARREVVDYVRAVDLDYDGLVEKRPNERGTLQKTLRAEGGWGRRVHDRLVAYADDLRGMSEEDALAELEELDGVGEKTARTIYGVLERNPDGVRAGNVELGPGAGTLVRALAREVVERDTAPIDEPVTTDLRRLIRLPGSVHGGSGLVVRPLERDAVEAFDPLTDAVPERFRDRQILVDVTDPGPVAVGDDKTKVAEGVQSVREYVGVFLMARGRAEKATE